MESIIKSGSTVLSKLSTPDIKLPFIGNVNKLILLFIIIVFISVALWTYHNYIKPILNPTYQANEEWLDAKNIEENKDKYAEIFFFKTSWCPHCKKAQPIWDEFVNKNKDNKINGYNLIFREIDGDADETTVNQFDVKGYPTIKLKKNNEIVEYDAKPDINTLTQFINTVI
tara:strand:- start:21 stop:533 length:513 start_codon:yes stop_codon:yes gene_type:complete